MSTFRMNSPEGKAILALVRDGDYAHPGEEEAIHLAAALIERPGVRRVLDVGCGRGGTAAWFRTEGWGEVIGVDCDGDSIRYARSRYPNVRFHQADVANLDGLALAPFDLVYLMTAYYAFPDQREALRQMTRVTQPGGCLLLVDYTRPAGGSIPAELGAEIGYPVVPETLAADLTAEGWVDIRIVDWTPRFALWYRALLQRFERRRSEILRHWGAEWYQYVVSWYGALHQALVQQRLGGAAMTATRSREA